MGVFNYQKAKKTYANDGLMLEVINRLNDMDCYHLLRDEKPSSEDLQFFVANSDYKDWLSVCDGGLLFSTTLLGFTNYDEELDLPFSTLQEYNTLKQKRYYRIPNGFYVIAVLNYGDPICISDSDSKVYLWDTQEKEFTTAWESFADFLADECNIASQMIQDGALEPVPMKAMEEQNG